MGFRDLLLLKEKEYRLYLILIVWLLIGFTLIQFEVLSDAGAVILLFLMVISFILFINALLPFKKLSEMSAKRIIITIIIFGVLIILFSQIFFGFFYLMLILAAISYVFITAVFTMYYFYKLGVNIDEYLYKLPSSLRHFERWCFFLGGTIISIVLLIVAAIFSQVITGGAPETVGVALGAIIIVVIIIIFGIIGALHALRGRLYAWMGIFFVWVAIYTIYLMIALIYSSASTGGGTTSIPAQILLYFFSLFVLLSTIGSLIGEKAEILKEKLKIFGSDTILIWLIFSIATYEFLSGSFEPVQIARNVAVYILFILLLIFMTIYGIRNYGDMVRERDLELLEKAAKEEGVIEEEQILCRECGAVNNASDVFCTKCGAELK